MRNAPRSWRISAVAAAAVVTGAGALGLAVSRTGDDDRAGPGRATTTSTPPGPASTTSIQTTTTSSTTAPPRTPQPDDGRPPVATTPQDLADQIAIAERASRAAAGIDDAEAARQGGIAQVAYRHVAQDPERLRAVLALLPDDVAPAAEKNLAASVEAAALVGTPPTELPSWRIRAPKPAKVLLGLYREAADRFGLRWEYLAAIHLVETRMGRIEGLSSAGAQGPMQFMPRTWEAYGMGGDVHDDRDAIFGAANYLAASGAPADWDRALWAYNHSDHYGRMVTAYADVMRDDERAFHGYRGWEVYYRLPGGSVLLPVGWVHPDA